MQNDEHQMISYAHKADPKGPRFAQFTKDKIPDWAVDIQPYEHPAPHATDRLVQFKSKQSDVEAIREAYDKIAVMGLEKELTLLIEKAYNAGRVSEIFIN